MPTQEELEKNSNRWLTLLKHYHHSVYCACGVCLLIKKFEAED